MLDSPGTRTGPGPHNHLGRDDYECDLVADLDWEWVYSEAEEHLDNGQQSQERSTTTASHARHTPSTPTSQLKRRIVGARHGRFVACVGEAFILKNDAKEPWIAILHECIEEESDGQKLVSFMWFSSPREIRNSAKRRTDFLPNELYITSNFDNNTLDTIIGRASIFSHDAFKAKFPTGNAPIKAREFGRVFVCRRGCNTRTATYTKEFVWEDIYQGFKDLDALRGLVDVETKATRKRKAGPAAGQYDLDYSASQEDARFIKSPETPRKRRRTEHMRTLNSPSTDCLTTPRKTTTPGHRRVVTKKPLHFTPLGTRTVSPQHFSSPFQLARSKLHVSAVPSALPCREAEFDQVYTYLESAITAGTGSCIYISGTPGTGKTATVREVIASLAAAVEAEELDDFIFVEINGMKVTDPHQSYSYLWEALTGSRLSPAHALSLLEREFSNPSPRRVPCVVLMDELDQLVTKTQSVMYNFFNWPGLQHSRLIVLAVANTMDLPERTLSNKISSRLGLTRITFPGYNHDQLIKIIESRLSGVPGHLVDADAVQFASRKVAQVSGDARRALDICRRAVEIAEDDAMIDPNSLGKDHGSEAPPSPGTPSKKQSSVRKTSNAMVAGKQHSRDPLPSVCRVTIATIQRAIREATTSPLQRFLRSLPLGPKLFLSALLTHTRRHGVVECVMSDVIDEATTIANTIDEKSLSKLSTKHDEDIAACNDDLGENEMRGRLKAPLRDRAYPKSTSTAMTPRVRSLAIAATKFVDAGVLVIETGGGTTGRTPGERTARVRLNVAEEEIRIAFRGDEDIIALGLIDR